MQSDLPKVLHPLLGKPLILHVLDSLNKAGIGDTYVVVGYQGQQVIDVIGDRAAAVWQHEQLGTGHAVMQAEDALAGFQGKVVVACGDVPLIRPETFRELITESEAPRTMAVVLTMILENPTGYGRIVRDSSGTFVKIVEEKDASPEHKLIREVNTGTYVFDKDHLFNGLKHIDTDNAQREYYLPDVLTAILKSGFNVKAVPLKDPIEGRGINTKEELLKLGEYCKGRMG